VSGIDVTSAVLIDRPATVVAGLAGDPHAASQWIIHLENVTWQLVERVPDERIVLRTDDGPFPLELTCSWAPFDDDPTKTVVTLRTTASPTGPRRLLRPLLANAIKKANLHDLIELRDLLQPR
jgi:hypothetical protein